MNKMKFTLQFQPPARDQGGKNEKQYSGGVIWSQQKGNGQFPGRGNDALNPVSDKKEGKEEK
jgi:hypothetical protein